MTAMASRILGIVTMCMTPAAGADVENSPLRVSIAPGNDLSVLKVRVRSGGGFGSAVCGIGLSEAYQTGHGIGLRNDHYGKRNFLMIDDGKTQFPEANKETGLPVVVLTDATLTQELREMVQGYNSAMIDAWKARNGKNL